MFVCFAFVSSVINTIYLKKLLLLLCNIVIFNPSLIFVCKVSSLTYSGVLFEATIIWVPALSKISTPMLYKIMAVIYQCS